MRTQVVNARAALLCNYEVLSLLRDSEAEQLAHAKAAFAVKNEHDAAPPLPTDEVCENLRTVEFEVRPSHAECWAHAPYLCRR